MSTLFDNYGKVKQVTTREFPQESLWDIHFCFPSLDADEVMAKWPKEELFDLGGGVKALTCQTVYKRGKEFLAGIVGERAEELWAMLEKAAQQEASLFL